jgi:hypothetical protein
MIKLTACYLNRIVSPGYTPQRPRGVDVCPFCDIKSPWDVFHYVIDGKIWCQE